MAFQVDVPFTESMVDEAVLAAYDGGDLLEDGEPSVRGKLVAKIAAKLLDGHKVAKLSERIKGALHHDILMEHLFPTVHGPRAFSRAENPDLAKRVYRELTRDVQGVTSPNADSLVQRTVAAQGYVLCRIPLSGGRANDGYYLTQNWKCIQEDFCPQYRRRTVLANERYGEQMDLLIHTVPALAHKAKREYDLNAQLALDAGANKFASAFIAATSESNNGSGPDDAAAADSDDDAE